MAEISIVTKHRVEMLDLTAEVAALLPPGFECGICHLFTSHTTGALTINENCDPDVRHDMLAKLEKLIPHQESFYRHVEGNSAAHLKASLFGFSLAIPVIDGQLALGTWQGIYFCEFDGPRPRRIRVLFQRSEE